ncbi:MAG: glutamate---cysteine ligase / carboxylate-amine ligase [Gaiellaceae bacterium]|jgi:carboxylate-amine ligase|nr:glutamate---cysteine ligase / carboxylate-amine ligase [Gaiellaceae bacterium]
MIEQHFGESSPFSLGVEEELMILDAVTFEQVAAVDKILNGVEGMDLPGRVKTELFASVFETNTNVCATVGEVDEALPVLRRAAATAAAREGLAIGAAATHPFALPEAQPIVKEERYVTFVGYGGITVRRQGVQGLHVHIGMPSAEECWQCLEAILPWLPLVLGLSANSPWYAGALSGMASNRAPVLAELPRAGVPPAFASYAEWETWVERLMRLGVTEEYTRIWWDVRPHPKLGTLEVRIPDQPTDVHLSAAFTALLQALCATALAGGLPRDESALGDRGRADYVQNRWSAARFGPRAKLLHPDGQSYVLASELAAELFELVRPAARELGGEAFLDRIDPSGCEADLQLTSDTAPEATAQLVHRSLG